MSDSKPLFRLLIMVVALAIAMTGCDRRTPDERLATAIQFYQQGDAASAEMEALKVVEKAPNDPAGVQASVVLANIYMQQNRLDEAQMQLEGALQQVSQLDPMGKEVLRMYLSTLMAQNKYDEALETIDKYQTEYADDPGTSISLRVARANTQTLAGETTAARQALNDIIDMTTSPAEMALYRDMYLKTYLQDEDTTSAIAYMEKQLAEASTVEDKLPIVTGLASLTTAQENYEGSRHYLKQMTQLMVELMQDDHDLMSAASNALHIGQIYLVAGNLPGAKKVFGALYDSPISDPAAVGTVVNSLVETHLRLGETSATQQLLADAAEKHPKGPFKQALQNMNDFITSGQLEQIAPMDTSTLALRYKADPDIIWPVQLPQILRNAASGTTGTVTATTGTATAVSPSTGTQQVDTETTEATVNEPASTPETIQAPPSETTYSAAGQSAAAPATETVY